MPNYGCIFISACQFSQQPNCKENESDSKADTVRQKGPSSAAAELAGAVREWLHRPSPHSAELLSVLHCCL